MALDQARAGIRSTAPSCPPATGRDAASPPGRDPGRHALWASPVDRRCTGCGYGIAAERIPDRCPMCGGLTWRVALFGPEPPAA